MKLFPEEQAVLNKLLEEWYQGVDDFTEKCNGIFTDKAKMYDKSSPVWERIRFPFGFLQELRKKTDRLSQLLEPYDGGKVEDVNWPEVFEELGDVVNYSRMLASLIRMRVGRGGSS